MIYLYIKNIKTEFGENMKVVDSLDEFLIDRAIRHCVQYDDAANRYLKTADGTDFIYKTDSDSEEIASSDFYKCFKDYLKTNYEDVSSYSLTVFSKKILNLGSDIVDRKRTKHHNLLVINYKNYILEKLKSKSVDMTEY